MRCAILTLAVLVTVTTASSTEHEHSWKDVVYLGGVPGVRVERTDGRQTLVVHQDRLMVTFQPAAANAYGNVTKQPLRVLFLIPRENLIAFSCQSFRHDMPAAQGWIGIHGTWPRSTDYLIVIEYRLRDGKDAEILLRVPKKHFAEIVKELDAMLPQSRTVTPSSH